MIPKERLDKALQKFFGLADFRPGQTEVINSVLNGFDTLAVMPTGGGKSICYQLPAILMDGLAIVVTPLISLMKDQVLQINRLGLHATELDSTLEAPEFQSRLNLAKSGKVKLLYVAPERLGSRRFVDSLSQTKISLLVVDEAHCVSQWGHDFRPHYSHIPEFAESMGNPGILALTATATPDVQDDIVAQLKMRSPRVYISGFNRENLSFRVLVETAKMNSILRYANREGTSGIVYASTRKSVDEIYDFLKSHGLRALRYHAGLPQSEREASQTEFLRTSNIMVATNAFGMGINKPDIRYVIHFELPGTMEAYYQEAGRAGRDGKPAECVLLFNKKDISVQEYFIDTLYPTKEIFLKIYGSLFDSLSVGVSSTREDFLTVSTQKLAEVTGANGRTIDAVFRILSQSGLLQIMPSISATAYVSSKMDMTSYRRAVEKTSSHDSRAVLEALLRMHGSALFSEPQIINLDEIGRKSEIGPSNAGRTLSLLHRSGVINYKPPSEGITFRMLTARVAPERLPVNFEQLSLLRERARQRLAKMVGYALDTGCRTNYILEYFGADEIEGGCANCDNCTVMLPFAHEENKAEETLSAREIHREILSLVRSAKGTFGRSRYCKILLGNSDKDDAKAPEIMDHAGALKSVPAQAIYSSFDFLLSRKFLVRNGLVYPTVAITEEGEKYLNTGIPSPARKRYVLRKALHKALRDERRALSSELRIPVFNICSDETLKDIANEHPTDIAGLSKHLAQSGANASMINRRILQVCADFSSDLPAGLAPAERKVYELFREKLTAAEIADALSLTVQGVIETLEGIGKKGIAVDLRSLVNSRTFSVLKRELEEKKDVLAVHKAVEDCELAEVALVARITGAAT